VGTCSATTWRLRGRRLWDELVPTPTRQFSARLIVSHAGFQGESEPLYGRDLPDCYGPCTKWPQRADGRPLG
jgi:hypothetical protein